MTTHNVITGPGQYLTSKGESVRIIEIDGPVAFGKITRRRGAPVHEMWQVRDGTPASAASRTADTIISPVTAEIEPTDPELSALQRALYKSIRGTQKLLAVQRDRGYNVPAVQEELDALERLYEALYGSE